MLESLLDYLLCSVREIGLVVKKCSPYSSTVYIYIQYTQYIASYSDHLLLPVLSLETTTVYCTHYTIIS